MLATGTRSTVVRTSRGLSIADTRITLYDIMDYLTADWPPKLIQQWLNLSDTQIADLPPKPGQEAAIAKLRARKAELGLA